MSGLSMSPEQSRIRQSIYRSRQRERGMSLVNKWVSEELRNELYEIIDFINDDSRADSADFVKFMLDVIKSENGSCFFGKNIEGAWRFEVRHPNKK